MGQAGWKSWIHAGILEASGLSTFFVTGNVVEKRYENGEPMRFDRLETDLTNVLRNSPVFADYRSANQRRV